MLPSADLRLLDADLPACPRTLLDMLVLLNDEDAPATAMAAVVERDMALGAAVVRTVNSAMYGLLRRVETVNEAVRYLGTREVAAITFSTALRSAFPATRDLEALWDHASRCGMLMGRSAAALGLDPWRAHTAGLFARCGQAVLMAKYPTPYGQLLADFRCDDDSGLSDAMQLAQAETEAFGVSHAVYGSALCAAWGLSPDVVKFVRDRVENTARWRERDAPLRDLLGLGAMAERMLLGGDASACATRLADELASLRAPSWLNAVSGPWAQMHLRETSAPEGVAVH